MMIKNEVKVRRIRKKMVVMMILMMMMLLLMMKKIKDEATDKSKEETNTSHQRLQYNVQSGV